MTVFWLRMLRVWWIVVTDFKAVMFAKVVLKVVLVREHPITKMQL